MNSKWLKGSTKSEKDAVRQQIKSAKPVLDRLAVILTEQLESSLKALSGSDLDSPNWGNHTAHQLGGQQAIRDILKLIDIEDK